MKKFLLRVLDAPSKVLDAVYVESEPGFVYVSMYFFGFYVKDMQQSAVSLIERERGIVLGRLFIKFF